MCPTLTLDAQISSHCVTSRTFHELDPASDGRDKGQDDFPFLDLRAPCHCDSLEIFQDWLVIVVEGEFGS